MPQAYAQFHIVDAFFVSSYSKNISCPCVFAKLMFNIYNQLFWISQEDKELW